MKLWRSLLLGIYLCSAIATKTGAQISSDGTTNTTVNQSDNIITIDSGDRAGDNLFHSFEQFSLTNGSEAFFNNQSDIANIFSRVTGGNVSEIEGLIRANGDANLFLINSAGIVFGEGAALDIGGSFTATTAESIVFSDGVEFYSVNSDNSPLLTVNMPIGLNYGSNTGDITVNGSSLTVAGGENIALLGGDVTITGGQIIAPGANVELGGLSKAGQVSLEIAGNKISSIAATQRSDVTLTNGTTINVQATGGGNIAIYARNLELSGGELGESNIIAGIALQSRSPQAQAGDITFNATGNITVNRGSSIFNSVEESGIGNSGGIDITTMNLFLIGGGQIFASTFGQGNAGEITIDANGTIEAEGESSQGFPSGIKSRVESTAIGNTSGVNITTQSLSLGNGGVVEATTTRQGNAGKITINAKGSIEAEGESSQGFSSGIKSSVELMAIGNSDGIDITTTDLSLGNGGVVGVNTTGQGNAGKIKIDAKGTIEAEGESSQSLSGIFSIVEETGQQDAEGIDLITTNLSLSNGGQVSASTTGKGDVGKITIDAKGTIEADGENSKGNASGIFSIVEETGQQDAGGIDLIATNLSLSNGGQVSTSTFGRGNAGKITIDANGTIEAEGESLFGFPSGIFSRVELAAIGDSSGINITTTDLSLTKGSVVEASTSGQGNAGEIMLNAKGTIEADGESSQGFPGGIFSIVEKMGKGNAADININTSSLFVANGAEISVESLGQGNAGNLEIQANAVALSNGASLFASTPVNTGGNINLQIAENLILRDNSTISALALEDADGGNITIDADFVIAFLNQNNDIIASATSGMGGNIKINTNAIFGGLEERRSIPDNNTNDIDPSSELGVDGTIEINELEVNPTEALEELPTEVIDLASLVEQNLCQQGKGSEFIVTGKGGVASSPTQARDGSVGEVDLVKPVFSEAGGAGEAREAREAGEAREIVEAKGWIVNDRGMVELVANKTDIDRNPTQPQVHCHK